MNAPRVTVGIPFLNARRTLADAIRSVLAQTLTDWELILVDDGSTDGSLEVARSIDDPRVRVVSDGRNLRLAARLNQIVALARAELIARMDADDLMHPDRLAAQVEFLDQNPAVDVVGTGMYILDQDGRPAGKRFASLAQLTARRVFAGVHPAHATTLGRKGWLDRNHYDSSSAYVMAEDFELWCRTFGRSHFASLPFFGYYCTEHASFSLSKYAACTRSVVRVTWRHGVEQIGFPACCALSAKQLAKLLVYAAAVGLRVRGRLIARRSVPLTPSEKEQVAADLVRIRRTPLPLRWGTPALIPVHQGCR